MHDLVNWPVPGKYLLAVSGGADSMALLDLMAVAAGERRYELAVAHFDHGLRPESPDDRRLVEQAAASHSLPFVYHEAHLGTASEAAARSVRYSWLEQARVDRGAMAVITAHHQDDLIETSLLNLARGSGRRGLAPMQAGPLLRPLLPLSRAELRTYAKAHRLQWHEDPTNTDLSNPRNFLRHRLLPLATPGWRARYLDQVERLASLNNQINQDLASMLAAHRSGPNGYSFPLELIRDLSLPELEELIFAAALSLSPSVEPGARAIRELGLFAKTAPAHRFRELRQGLRVVITPQAVCMDCSLPHTKLAR